MAFLKILKMFILNSIFNSDDEYNPRSSKFNPFKVVVFVILVSSFIFNIYIIHRLTYVYKIVDEKCPTVEAQLEND